MRRYKATGYTQNMRSDTNGKRPPNHDPELQQTKALIVQDTKTGIQGTAPSLADHFVCFMFLKPFIGPHLHLVSNLKLS